MHCCSCIDTSPEVFGIMKMGGRTVPPFILTTPSLALMVPKAVLGWKTQDEGEQSMHLT